MWLWLYLANVLFAVIAAVPVSRFIKSSIGQSMAFDKVELFNFSSLGELLIHHSGSIDIISLQAQILIAIYLILTVLLIAGVAGVIRLHSEGSPDYSFSDYIKIASENFWRFIRLALYVLSVKLIILFLAYKLWTVLAGGTNFFSLNSSAQWTRAFKILLPFVILIFSFISMISDYIKMSIVSSNRKLIFSDVRDALKNIMQKPLTAISLYILNVITVSALLIIIALLRKNIEQNSMTMVILSVMLTQLIILIRLGFRVVNLKSISHHIASLK